MISDDIKEKEEKRIEPTATGSSDDIDLSDIDMEIDLGDIFDATKNGEKKDYRNSTNTKIYEKSDILGESDNIEVEKIDETSGDNASGTAITESEDRINSKNRRGRAFIFSFLAILSAISLVIILASPLFKINNIEVKGNDYYTDEQIINMSNARTGGNLFLKAGKSSIKRQLMSDPYFKSVKVGRKLPGTLVITVEEKEQIAALKYGDRYVVIDPEGTVLRVAKIDPEITVIEGFTIETMKPGKKVVCEEESILESTIETLELIKKNDLYFKRMVLNKVNVEAYIYDGLYAKGSSSALRASVASGDLRKVLNKLIKSEIKHGTIILGEDGYISFSPDI